MKKRQFLINSIWDQENIRRKFHKKTSAYILLESLISLFLICFLVVLVIDQVNRSAREIKDNNQQIEVLNVSKMAIDLEQSRFELNGVQVTVDVQDKQVKIFEKSKENREREVITFEIKKIEKESSP